MLVTLHLWDHPRQIRSRRHTCYVTPLGPSTPDLQSQTYFFQQPNWKRVNMTGQSGKVSDNACAAATLVILLLCGTLMPISVRGQSNGRKVKGAYYGPGNWESSTTFDFALYTHLFYTDMQSFIRNASVLIDVTDELRSFSADMKKINPDVLTSMQLYSAADGTFAMILQSQPLISVFINSSISLARSLNMDGIHLDWKHPRSPDNMTLFASFLTRWRQAVVAEAKTSSRAPLLLTAGAYYAAQIDNISYPVAAMSENLDFIIIVCYHFHEPYASPNYTGAYSILYDTDSGPSTDYGVTSWLEAGMSPEKIVLELSLYGSSWTLENQTANAGLNAPAIGPGPPLPRSNISGFFNYTEVPEWISTHNATVVRDEQKVTTYAFVNNAWLSYQDPTTISATVRYAMSKGLGGYLLWTINADDNVTISRTASETLDTILLDVPSPNDTNLTRDHTNIVFL